MFKKSLFALVAAGCLGLAAAPVQAQVYVQVTPPSIGYVTPMVAPVVVVPRATPVRTMVGAYATPYRAGYGVTYPAYPAPILRPAPLVTAPLRGLNHVVHPFRY